MKTNPIGQSNIQITEIALGGASIGNLFQAYTDEQAWQTLACAWDAGIRYFDTAPHYGRGRSEQRFGQFFKHKPRAEFVISTKVGRVLSPGTALAEADCYINPLANDVHYDYSGDGIEESLQGSLERLQTTQVDILYVHDIGTFTHGENNDTHMQAFLNDGYERLIKLKEKGIIKAFGLGVNENEVCLALMQHCQLDVILLAGRLTLLDRSAETELVKRCQQANTHLILGGAFNSGILATGATENATYNYLPATEEIKAKVNQLQAKAESLGMNLAQAALHFCKNHPASSALLLGTASAEMLQHNIALLKQAPHRDFSKVFCS